MDKWTVLAMDDATVEALAKLLMAHSMEVSLEQTNAALTEQIWALDLVDKLIPQEATAATQAGMRSLMSLARRRLGCEVCDVATTSRKVNSPGALEWISQQLRAGKVR